MKKYQKLLLIFFLFVGAPYLYIKTHKFVNLDPKDEKSLLSDAIIDTKKISIPGYPNAYNGSIIEYKDGYLLAFRVDSYSLSTWLQKLCNHRTSFQGLIRLSKDFSPLGKATILNICSFDPKVQSCPQDGRLYSLNDQVYLFYNDYKLLEKRSQEMYFTKVIEEGETFKINRPKLLSYSGSAQNIEKNWAPFSKEGQLHLVYQINPHTILKVDKDTGICTKVSESYIKALWNYGGFRGGSPAIEIGEEYISLFHSSKKGPRSLLSKKRGNVYFMGAYSFEKKFPFNIKKSTKHPL